MVKTPPKITHHDIKLPLTKLHYLTCGKGEPLIIVPATISHTPDWEGLIQFMGQHFKVYFFELPGHNKSEPFKGIYTSKKVAQTVRDFMDALNIERTNIFGYSFGGILTLHILDKIEDRVDKIVFFAPAVAHYALNYSRPRMKFIYSIYKILKGPKGQQWVLNNLCHNEKIIDPAMKVLDKIGKTRRVDNRFREKMLNLPLCTLNVLFNQIEEVFTFDLAKLDKVYKHKTYFGMSVNDPLIHYGRTKSVLREKFPNWTEIPFHHAFHQPPEPFTFEELNKDFYPLLHAVVTEEK